MHVYHPYLDHVSCNVLVEIFHRSKKYQKGYLNCYLSVTTCYLSVNTSLLPISEYFIVIYQRILPISEYFLSVSTCYLSVNTSLLPISEYLLHTSQYFIIDNKILTNTEYSCYSNTHCSTCSDITCIYFH